MRRMLESPVGVRGRANSAIPHDVERDRTRMRRLALVTASLSVVVAWGGIEPVKDTPREFRRLEADFDQAWEAAAGAEDRRAGGRGGRGRTPGCRGPAEGRPAPAGPGDPEGHADPGKERPVAQDRKS